MKKLFVFLMVTCVVSILAAQSVQAQNYNGNLEVTVYGSTTSQPAIISVTDNSSSAILSLTGVSFPGYPNLNITATVSKTGETINDLISIEVTGESTPDPIEGISASGTINSTACNVTFDLMAMYFISVQVHFTSN